MFQAQYLFTGDVGTPKAVYSPWMSRAGDDLRATFDLVEQNPAAIDLKVELFQKNSEDTGNGTVHAGGALTISSVGRGTKEWTGVEELVRFKFTTVSGAAVYDNVLFRMLTPVWFDAVSA